jgi:hypothetical protein
MTKSKMMASGGMMQSKMMASGGMMKKGYAAGGAAMPMVVKNGKKVPAFAAKKMMGGGMSYSKGGSASSRADGVASKGKTKGKLLNKGGMAKKYC